MSATWAGQPRRCAAGPCADPPCAGHDRFRRQAAAVARVRVELACGWRAAVRKCVARQGVRSAF